MSKKTLHIVNGDTLAGLVQELALPGEILVWRELLCEGPTTTQIDSRFFKLRKKFLFDTYKISGEDYESGFIKHVKKLQKSKSFEKVYLWFEFDLFCHVNMMTAIQVLSKGNPNIPIHLVCSKKLKTDKEFLPLCRLPLSSLKKHFDRSIALNPEDIQVAQLIWELYCCDNPMKLKAQITTKSNFEFLSSCIRAHIERFPNSSTGINSLERNILKLIETRKISSLHHLLGYALQHQGFYGYSYSQMEKILERLAIFYSLEKDRVLLTDKGMQVLLGKKNFYQELANDQVLGGVRKFDFLYDPELNRLLKL